MITTNQVEVFEKRMIEICEARCGQFFLNWNRWSDNCSGQFKSRNTLGKLVGAAEAVLEEESYVDCNVVWEFLEANEAKNESDTIGGFSKTALRQAMLRDPEILIRTAEEMVAVIQRGLDKSLTGSEKYNFVHVEAIPRFDRETVSVEIPVKGIRSLHSFSMLNGGILASQLSCLDCTVAPKCAACLIGKLSVTREAVEAAVEYQRDCLAEDSEDEIEAEFEESDAESGDDVASNANVEDDENSGGSDHEEEQSWCDPGSVVWVLWGRRRYPAKVVLLPDLPTDIRANLRKDDGKSLIVQFFGDLDFSRVNLAKLTELGQTSQDLR